MSETAPGRGRILIVEDEGIIAQHISDRLEKNGYEVAGVAESSEEALARTAELRPDLILMDIHIKGALDGIETAAAIHRTFDVPVIYLTAHSDRQIVDRAKISGAFAFLTKPIHHTNLATSIEMALHKHRADAEVRRHRAWLDAVMGAMGDGVAAVDGRGTVQYLNAPAEKLTGWSNGEARGRNLAEILPLVDPSTGAAVAEALSPPAAARPFPRGVNAVKRTGETFAVEGEIAPSRHAGIVVGAIVTFRDNTTRRLEEREARQQFKMQAIGRLASGVAHDFNNLLFVILGYTEDLLRTAPPGDRNIPALEQIAKAGHSAAAITGQWLRFSRKEAAELREVNLNDVIGGAADLCRRLAGPAVRVNLRLDPVLHLIRADPAQIEQILMNLMANARDAMPQGGAVTIETANAGGSVALRLADTGVGMTAETAEHLFEPFFTTKGPGQGTGLGLSIVHGIVTDLGGSIGVASRPGEGACFTISIPRACHAAPVEEKAPAAAQSIPATVLLIEQLPHVRRILRDYLTPEGCHVLEAASHEEAVRVAELHDGRVDLVVAGVRQSGGLEGVRTLTAHWKRMDVICIPGFSADMIGKQEGVERARFLPQPFAQKDLLSLVRALLK